MLTKGDSLIQAKVYKDRDWGTSYDGGSMTMQRADHADQPVMDDDRFRYDKVNFQDKLLTQIRYDISAGGALSEFAFELDTVDQFEFVGYSVEYQVDVKKTIRGKGVS